MTATFTRGVEALFVLGLSNRVMARIFGLEPASGGHSEVHNCIFVQSYAKSYLFYSAQNGCGVILDSFSERKPDNFFTVSIDRGGYLADM
jgi:hypothetical protein